MGAKQNRMFFASLAFLALILLPVWFASFTFDAEDKRFQGGNQDLISIGGIEETADLGNQDLNEFSPFKFERGDLGTHCQSVEPSVLSEISQGVVSDIDLNLTTFGDGYAATVVDNRGKVYTFNRHNFPDDKGVLLFGFNTCHIELWYTVKQSVIRQAEVFRFIVHEAQPRTYEFVSVWIMEREPAAGLANEVFIDHSTDPYTTGNIREIQWSPFDRIAIDQGIPDPIGPDNDLLLKLNLVTTFNDMPNEGELVIYDMEFLKSRDGRLSSTGKLITFNIIYIGVTGFAVLVALPWISGKDFIPKKKTKKKRKKR